MIRINDVKAVRPFPGRNITFPVRGPQEFTPWRIPSGIDTELFSVSIGIQCHREVSYVTNSTWCQTSTEYHESSQADGISARAIIAEPGHESTTVLKKAGLSLTIEECTININGTSGTA